jgi:hypothetical protein
MGQGEESVGGGVGQFSFFVRESNQPRKWNKSKEVVECEAGSGQEMLGG